MKCTKITAQTQSILTMLINAHAPIGVVVKAIDAHGGRVLLVGGAVRDMLLNMPIKDIDIEVHGITLEQLQKILAMHGNVDLVGKAYGVLRLQELDVDWAVPRVDTAGRKPTVTLDPTMDMRQAFIRRDLTINAMGIDLITFELIDPFDGLHDLRNKILRTPDPEFFVEDPLRLFRVMQFIGRFEFAPDIQLNAMCAQMSLAGISVERIEDEFEKLLLKSRRPSLGILWLRTINRLQEILPEVYALIGVPQRPDWHPEGDVFVHTMQAFDAAARISYDSCDDMLIVRYAALCHDLGKATTTRSIDGIWRSHGHAQAGVPLAKSLLRRITHKKALITSVAALVNYHMHPGQLIKSDAGLSAYKRLAHKLEPLPLLMLLDLMRADRQGRNAIDSLPLEYQDPDVLLFERKIREAGVLMQHEPPVLLGRDLLDVVAPGAHLGELLKRAYQIQIDEGITDKEMLKARVLAQ